MYTTILFATCLTGRFFPYHFRPDPSKVFQRRTFGGLLVRDFYKAGCPSRHSSNSVKVLTGDNVRHDRYYSVSYAFSVERVLTRARVCVQFLSYYYAFLYEVSTDDEQRYANFTRRTLRRTNSNGMRFHPPSSVELAVRNHLSSPSYNSLY